MPNKFLPPTTTTATRTAATPIDGEVLYDTDEKKLYYGDGTTQGGKAIGSSTVSDSEFRIQDNGDATKQIALEASGITTGTTRTLTPPDASGTIALIDTTGLSDKDLFYYDSASKLFKRIAIGTTDQALIAKPSLSPPYQWGTVASSGRELLTANRIYYVRTDGSDSNDGLINTAGGAFLTIQKMSNILATLDLNGYSILIQLTGDFTSQGTINIYYPIGSGSITLQGNVASITDVKIKKLNFTNQKSLCTFIIDSFQFFNPDDNGTSLAIANSTVYHGRLSYLSNGFVVNVSRNGQLYKADDSSITFQRNSGTNSLQVLFYAIGQSVIDFQEMPTITFVGSPTFSLGVFYAEGASFINIGNVTQTGAKTGTVYVTAASSNSTIRKQDYSYQSST